jgi:hypothetical protein
MILMRETGEAGRTSIETNRGASPMMARATARASPGSPLAVANPDPGVQRGVDSGVASVGA